MFRLSTATLFAGAALAFALPFGAVSSCGGEEVRFTGVELATFTVRPETEGTLHTEVERNGAAFALTALVASVLGAAFAAIGRVGGGVCASFGLLAMQLLFGAVLVSSDGGELFIGFWLALISLSTAAILHLTLAVRRTRRAPGGSGWAYATPRVAFTLLPTLVVAPVIVVAGIASLFE